MKKFISIMMVLTLLTCVFAIGSPVYARDPQNAPKQIGVYSSTSSDRYTYINVTNAKNFHIDAYISNQDGGKDGIINVYMSGVFAYQFSFDEDGKICESWSIDAPVNGTVMVTLSSGEFVEFALYTNY